MLLQQILLIKLIEYFNLNKLQIKKKNLFDILIKFLIYF